ncbi:nucleolar MIF4G domain-containing protein 1 homolog [Phlebotomus argentipes]|uniref:nucleolar MIF4G domain-containing protein 1 homolog n=1 Tax=Phlebotomus argentipes TaxID=94469 RepID=UPI002892E007|nr:nucleolar MIF4G domain-containing protein 1 homolog [Phlebotomus argentipes]
MGRKPKTPERKKKPPTRKELRKQKREQKKKLKHTFFSQKKKKVVESKKKKTTIEKTEISDEEIPSDDELPSPNPVNGGKAVIEHPLDRFKKAAEKQNKLVKEITSGSRKRRIKQLKAENEKEDRLIRQLEKKLKIDKKRGDKSVPKCFDDGFDYILELCLPENIDNMYKAAKEAKDLDGEGSKGEELRLKDAEKRYFGSDSELESVDSEIEENIDEELGNIGSDSEDDVQSHRYVRAPEYLSDDSEDEELQEEEEEENDNADEESNYAEEENSDADGVEEDIYGRTRDKAGNVVNGKYIPPHMRAQQASSDEKLQRLRKQLKGWLNRLAEANLQKIAKDTEDLYMKNSRHDMNHTLCSLIVESIVTPVNAVERMVQEHALFIAVLHANVGSEVGAHFLEALVQKFDTLLNQMEAYDVEEKQLDNVVLFLCHLYTFRICHHSLIFELLKRVSAELSEKCVECILVVLRSVGFALRKDDPVALKEFIGEIRQKADTLPEALKDNPRMKFMLDILVAVKNNNMLKIPNYDPSLAEHLRKLLKGILRNEKYVTTLNIRMDDLLAADQKGKWWIVGSAWTGRQSEGQGSVGRGKNGQKFSSEVLELAKKHRMNTEDKTNVFCTLMTATDQTDAVNRLLELSIKDTRVIATILIYSCLCEPAYNAFYAVVAQQLCSSDRKHRLAIQFASWDKIKVLGNLNDNQIDNFSKFLAHLIEEGAQSLSILKVIDFGQIDKASVKLVRRIMLTILLKDDYTCRKVFDKIAPSAKLKSFKVSLKLFLQHFLVKKANKLDLPEDQLQTMMKRIAIADESLSSSSRVLL